MEDTIFNEQEQNEKEALSEDRKKAIKRMYALVYYFVDEMLDCEDKAKFEEAEFERLKKAEPDQQIFMVGTGFHNAEVMKNCMRSARDAAKFLNDKENDIEDWQIAGINAMFDYCSAEKIVPYDLPEVIKGLLCMHIAGGPCDLTIECKVKVNE